MGAVSEVWIVEPMEGKTKAEQTKRLEEWRDAFIADGAGSVTIYEGGYGEYNGAWVFCINHESGEAWGKLMDKYSAHPDTFDTLMEAWQKAPVLKFRGGGLLHYSEALSKSN